MPPWTGFADKSFKSTLTLDFKVSARGWCCILEEHGLSKGEFDAAERLINDCRKNGKLPTTICAEDQTRLPDNAEELDEPDPVEEAKRAITILKGWHETWKPFSFWQYQKYFICMVVEKVDLKSLFSPICADYHIECANATGWNDINSRSHWRSCSRNGKSEERSASCYTAGTTILVD